MNRREGWEIKPTESKKQKQKQRHNYKDTAVDEWSTRQRQRTMNEQQRKQQKSSKVNRSGTKKTKINIVLMKLDMNCLR